MHGIEWNRMGARFVLPLQGNGDLFGDISRAFASLQPGLSHCGPSARLEVVQPAGLKFRHVKARTEGPGHMPPNVL